MPKAKIYYYRLPSMPSRQEKLDLLKETHIETIPFELIRPDEKGNWINQTDNDFQTLIPLCAKEVKLGKGGNAIFQLFSLGVSTNRDEWSYDFDKQVLIEKANYFIDFFNEEKRRWQISNKEEATNDFVNRNIKWTSELENHLVKNTTFHFDQSNIIVAYYRPFVKKYFYFDKIYTHRIYQNEKIFGFRNEFENKIICFTDAGSQKPFMAMVVNTVPDLHFVSPACGTNCLPLYCYENGERKENITDWALEHFRTVYKASSLINGKGKGIQKLDIFHYVYAVLHKPEYRTKYELDLKREFPRIPLYDDFWKYAEIGKKLMALHLNYEKSESEFSGLKNLQNNSQTTEKAVNSENLAVHFENSGSNKVILKANKTTGEILLTDHCKLTGVPSEVWEYKLGNRSAVEWVLDQYKPYKSDDRTIQEQFNAYDFADYQEEVIELLQKVVAVSVETVRLVREL